MDYPRRRGRRRRSDTFASLSVPNHSCNQQTPRQWCFINSVTSFLILSSLIGIIYLMLDYHCYSCSKIDASALVKNVEQISVINVIFILKNTFYKFFKQQAEKKLQIVGLFVKNCSQIYRDFLCFIGISIYYYLLKYNDLFSNQVKRTLLHFNPSRADEFSLSKLNLP